MNASPGRELQIGLIGRGESTARLAAALVAQGLTIRHWLAPAELTAAQLGASDIQVWLLDVQDADWNDALDELMDSAPVPLFFNEHGAIDRQPHADFWCRNLIRHIEALLTESDAEVSPVTETVAIAEAVADQHLLSEIAALGELLQADAPVTQMNAEAPAVTKPEDALADQRFDDELGVDVCGDEIVVVKADEALEAEALAAIPLLGETMLWPESARAEYNPSLNSPQTAMAETAGALVQDSVSEAVAAAPHTSSNVIPLLVARAPSPEGEASIPVLREIVTPATPDFTAAGLDAAPDAAAQTTAKAPEPLSCELWVLGSSLGGPAALKRFFSALVEPIPVCFLIAQHIDGHFVPVLAKIIEQANAFYSVSILNRPGLIEAGTVLMTPTDKRLRFLEAGQIVQCQRNWTPPYAPSIDDVLLDAAAAYPGQVNTIIFSGMGEDGVEGVRRVHNEGGQVWAQDSESCASAVMPEGAVNTGLVQYRGTPEQLAERLSAYYRATAAGEQQS